MRPQPPPHLNGDWYSLGEFGSLRVTVGYYIDALTLCMFCMVTLVASCIHVYSAGYMHGELSDVFDTLGPTEEGRMVRRRGRYHRFFQYLSLFCFSMLGLVLAGNVAMVFVFWELVGICSYLLIGFWHERKSASNAANKAFIVNRVGDFGMIVGLMAVWAGLGTFSFGDYQGPGVTGRHAPCRASSAKSARGERSPIAGPDGMVRLAAIGRLKRRCCRQGRRPHDQRAAGWLESERKAIGVGLAAGAIAREVPRPTRRFVAGIVHGQVPEWRAKATATGCWSLPGWAFSAAAWARARRCRCTSGCRTRWKAPRPSAP